MMNYNVLIAFKTIKEIFNELYDIDADAGSSVLGLTFRRSGHVLIPYCEDPEQVLEKDCSHLIDLGYSTDCAEQAETTIAIDRRKQLPVILPQFAKGHSYVS